MVGKVYIVGGGPGSTELLTVKARSLIDTANAILYDSLTGQEIIEGFPESAAVYDVGKKPGPAGRRSIQPEINQLLVDLATEGDRVVRLKGGDPMVFGRGGEEAAHLANHGIPFEIVPGVSSIVAAPGVVGIPISHREYASSVTIVPGYEDPTKSESALDWDALAANVQAGGTLLILMGVKRLPDNVEALLARGLPADLPVAMIERATWDEEQTVTGTLETIVEKAENAAIEPPAMTVVGEVVSIYDEVEQALHRDAAESLEIPTAGIYHPNQIEIKE